MTRKQQLRIAAYADGQLDPVGQLQVQQLLQESEVARAYLDHLQSSSAALRNLPNPAVDAEQAWQQLQPQLSRQPHAPATRRSWSLPRAFPVFAGSLAATAVALVLSFVFLSHTPQSHLSADAVQLLETDIVGGIPIVFLDQPSGWTVVWVAQPNGE